ncbi:MAG: hypothetical protein IJW77_16110 [Clostridia bacterium]|nr:hypothetical protein [Clostridia bacterium]
MKPFVNGEKRYAFDITNADDVLRLERAFAEQYPRVCAMRTAGETDDAVSPSEQMRMLYALYHDFFETVFPGRGDEIVGSVPSAAAAGRAYERFITYLHACIDEESRHDAMVQKLYLDGAAGAGGVPDPMAART